MASHDRLAIHDLKQKAEKFWNEIKDLKIPDVTAGKGVAKMFNPLTTAWVVFIS